MAEPTWDSNPLGEGPLALALAYDRGESTPPGLAAAAVAVAGRAVRLLPDKFGDLLRAHPRVWLACHAVGRSFWAIEGHLRAAGDRDALGLLWDLARECRLHDVGLFAQLVEDAISGRSTGLPGLDRLAETYRDAPAGPGVTSRPPDGESPASRAIREAGSILEVYLAQRRLLPRLEDQPDVPRPEDGEGLVERLRGLNARWGRFGPLTLGLQAQGSIALARASRNGLHLRRDVIDELYRSCDDRYRESSHRLFEDPAARRGFHWDGREVRLTRSRLPDEKVRNREKIT